MVKSLEVLPKPLVPRDKMDLDQVVLDGRGNLTPLIAPNTKLNVFWSYEISYSNTIGGAYDRMPVS
jgi:hypothetical protein